MCPTASSSSGQQLSNPDNFAQLKDDVKAALSVALLLCVEAQGGKEFAWCKETTPGLSNFDTVETSIRHGNDCFIPPSRQSLGTEDIEPTLVILTGSNEQLSELQENTKRWFAVTKGDVRMALIHAINTRDHTMTIEQWQLRRPALMRAIVINPPLCPRERQPAHLQRPFCAQRRTLTSTELIGGPLLLHFEALMDRDPVELESDLIIGWNDLKGVARNL
ncbi:hypothetical protein BDV06DRAFT_89390 [Aspergillus oleicola]